MPEQRDMEVIHGRFRIRPCAAPTCGAGTRDRGHRDLRRRTSQHIERCPISKPRLRNLFPEVGPETGRRCRVPWPTLEARRAGLQAQRRLPGDLQPHHPTTERALPGGRRIHRREAVGAAGLRAGQQRSPPPGREQPSTGRGRGRLRELDEDVRLGPSTGSIVDAAVAAAFPYRRLTEGSLVQFGWGRSSAASRPPRPIPPARWPNPSPRIPPSACCAPPACRCPGAAGPTPTTLGARPEVGLPVVVKPRDGNQGKGVTVNITARRKLEARPSPPPRSATT